VPLPHRLALVAEIDGVSFYDDSKATNVGAVYSALGGMRQPVVLIAGGRDKGGGYEMLRPLVQEKVRAMVLIGEAREAIAKTFANTTRIIFAEEMDEAVRLAKNMAEKGDAVLLSPACASFDMFKSYSHRGEMFTQAVARIGRQEAQ
ncbi:MAG: UDP-N-acetylmuramoylalanine--D-glutamate ligase, partial [Desulfobulbaceae bacterium]|nr:UDP-N-acetylmuramoylalanine--D-glutamate ligase [Desulfobulbaceae bacterium]HIJ91761.1 UDP-N-acetylmuramoylalanine--D-glutamate ligase [Deltaproteobacteria bacterium]